MNFIKTTAIAITISLASSNALASSDIGFYTKLGLGYGKNISLKKSGFVSELALGYNLDKNLAIDLSFSNTPKYKSSNSFSNSSNTSNIYMANVSYYIDLDSKITPFITAGLGLGSTKQKTHFINDNKNFKAGDKTLLKKSSLARTIGFGIAAPIHENISTEVAYKFLSMTNKTTTGKAKYSHSIIAGVKVHF